MFKWLDVLARIAQFVLGLVQQSRREAQQREVQEESRRIDSDPVAVFRERFGVRDDGRAGGTGTTTAAPDTGKHDGK
jgi:hypothetical protein